MDKQLYNKGYTMVEILLVLTILSILLMLFPFVPHLQRSYLQIDMQRIKEICLLYQTKAIKQHIRQTIQIKGNYIIANGDKYNLHSSTSCDYTMFHFTPQGTISQGFHMDCENRFSKHTLVAQIGSGSFDVR